MSPTHDRIAALDGIRALSIIFVLIAHTVPFGPGRWGLNAMSGLMGMSLFFCLSGFLITQGLARNSDALTFFVRRILRIVPAMVLYVLLMVVLFGIGWRAVAENLLFITNYFYDGRGRGEVAAPMTHLWSLSVEMHFYIAIGCAALLMGRRCIWLIPIAAVCVTALKLSAGSTANINTHLRVDEILAGGILALVSLQLEKPIRAALSRMSVLVPCLGVALALWVLSCHTGFGGVMPYFRAYTGALLVGVLIHSRLPVLHDLLESRPANYIAKISYALYIYHPVTVWGWMNSGTDIERYVFKRPFSYLMAWGAAHLSTFYWEERWQAFARRLTKDRPKRA